VTETLAFILDLGIAVGAALIGGVIARRAGQPPIVGYLLAGVAIGPFTPGFVGDIERISVLAEIGVVMLVFALGVEFSLRELAAVRRIAVGGGVAQIGLILAIGAILGLGLGLDLRAALVCGAVLAISSTLVVAKALTERGELDSLHGHAAIGWMIVQDLVTILFIVALPPLAGEGDELATLGALGLALAKGAVFLVLAYVAGTRLLPRVFVAVARLDSPELFLLAVFATALLTAFVSSAVFGLSLALGAFVAGVLVSESELSYQAAAEVIPFRDLFAVLFFVAVGMLVDPAALANQLPVVLAFVVVAVALKGAVSAGLSFALGLPARSAILLGAGIAQVGEFSLIVAEDARALELIDPAVYNTLLGATIVSIVVGGPVRAVADRIVRRVEDRTTARWIAGEALQAIGARAGPAAEASATPGPADDAPGGPSPASPPASPPAQRVAGRIPGRALRSRTEAALIAGEVERRRIVVAGCGRVGRIVIRAVRARSFACTAIDRDRVNLDEAAELGADILYGDAARPEILRRAGLEKAQVLIVAVGDPLTARLVAERARRINPNLMVASRARGRVQMRALRAAGVVRVADPESEVAVELARHALQRMGVSGPELAAITSGLRRDAYR
jgi:CPA2 family monovalent cation:H+ antiporter-2